MSFRLVVNPIACDGRGLCAELFPERIMLDDWGYPIVDPTPFSGSLTAHAKRAVNACPVLALQLERAKSVPAPAPRGGGATARGGATPERIPR